MSFARRWKWTLLLAGAMTGGACSSILNPGQLRVTVSADDTIASSADPVTVAVTAANVGGARVTWGPGARPANSTCSCEWETQISSSPQIASARRI